MKSTSQQIHSPTPPAVFAMLSYSERLRLTETSGASVKPGSSNPALEHLVHRANAMTFTLNSFEGYTHYGIND